MIRGMQECFRKYPEIYGGELIDDDENAEAPGVAIEDDHQVLKEGLPESPAGVAEHKAASDALPEPKPEPTDIPQKWDDATAANKEVEKQEKQEKKE
jgi:intermembrane space import and assembly protein 40